MHALFDVAVAVFEVLGVLVMLAGIPIAVIAVVVTWRRSRTWMSVVSSLRRSIGLAILLGLELLVAADIVKTLTAPGIEDVLVLGIIVVIRTVLSFALQIEIEGTLPWRRAVLTTAPQLIARSMRDGRDAEAGADD
jgi:uncharacterized membrane protein